MASNNFTVTGDFEVVVKADTQARAEALVQAQLGVVDIHGDNIEAVIDPRPKWAVLHSVYIGDGRVLLLEASAGAVRVVTRNEDASQEVIEGMY